MARAQQLRIVAPTARVVLKPIAYLDLVHHEAQSAGLPTAFVLAVIDAESAFNPRAKSHAGAQGLMQLMPSIQRAFGVTNPYDPQQNIRAGCALLVELKARYKGDVNLVLAAYNAGGRHVRRKGGIPWPKTRRYVAKIVRSWKRYEQKLLRIPAPNPIISTKISP